MPNPYFSLKQFTVFHDKCAMKVTTDACLFGAWAAKEMKGMHPNASSVLDIGTGTGLLSLMFAQQNDARFVAVEIEPAAAQQAEENFSESPWSDRMEVYTGNILDYKPAHLFDVIISNPPFYENELAAATNEKKLAHHSSELTFSELIPTVTKLLSPTGTFFMLIPFQRLQKTKIILAEHDLCILKIVTVRPSEQHEPFRCMLMIDRQKTSETTSIDMAMKSGQEYTNFFISLLRPYYLYL